MAKPSTILIAVLILIVAYVLVSYVRIVSIVHHSKNPVITQNDAILGVNSDARNNTNPDIKNPIRFIAAGDSTAFGEGASDAQHSYPYLFAQYIAQRGTVLYKNVAVSGATTKDLLINQISQIIIYNPDIITISIGANDRTHLASNNAIYKNFQDILAQLLAKTHATIYIADVPNFYNQSLLPAPYAWFLETENKSLNPRLLALQNSHPDNRVKTVDVHSFGWDQFPDIKVTFSADDFHPNNLGYQNWANAFINSLTNNSTN